MVEEGGAESEDPARLESPTTEIPRKTMKSASHRYSGCRRPRKMVDRMPVKRTTEPRSIWYTEAAV
jgi:hypothetical protein